MEQTYDVIIIGGGPGGYAAGLYCARAALTTLVFEKLSPGGQMATTEQVDNYPGFDESVSGVQLAMQMQKGAEKFGAKTVFAEVTKLDLSTQPKRIETTAGTYTAHCVILATGASPRPLGLPEEQSLRGRGVSYCATCDGRFFQGKTVAVIGGGDSAAADALTLCKLCKKVYIIHRRDSLRAAKSYLIPLEHTKNIEFIWNTQVSAILHDSQVTGLSLTNLQTHDTSELPCDGVFVAIGRVPDTQLVKGQIALDGHGYIMADETTQTTIPGVFAVGDVRTKPLRQIITAAADGAIASMYTEEYLHMQPHSSH